MKFKSILDTEGQLFSLNNMDIKVETNHWMIVAAEIISETSGYCIIVFTGDSDFLCGDD